MEVCGVCDMAIPPCARRASYRKGPVLESRSSRVMRIGRWPRVGRMMFAVTVRVREAPLVPEERHEAAGNMEHVLCLLRAPPVVLGVVAALVVRHHVEIHGGGVHHVAERVVERSVARSVERDVGVPVHVAPVDLVTPASGADCVVTDRGDLLRLVGLGGKHCGRFGPARRQYWPPEVLVTELVREFGEPDLVVAGIVPKVRTAPESLVSGPRGVDLTVAPRNGVHWPLVAADAVRQRDRLGPPVAGVVGGHDFPLAPCGPQRLRLSGSHSGPDQHPHAANAVRNQLGRFGRIGARSGGSAGFRSSRGASHSLPSHTTTRLVRDW